MDRIEKIIELMEENKELFGERSKKYGVAYIKHGKILNELLGKIEIDSKEDYVRFSLYNAILAKLTRYKFNSDEPNSNEDSLMDMANFCAMLAEYDRSIK